ncbi:ATP-dependent DNA ligase LigD ligase module /ATP-dependent DNA ligase LigD phosphoesterase module /ATP-dependent DNA ligase LigD polymerase module [Sanguibacter gelidistatuariae]|uniref:DNA ligase (ATP) n=1 Tax=Sanguibacter gelidistatuariae TaxID=1814289 RepID=A0A1G6RVG4_9MICO|nr:non-homologous end-joining DNA ligase [Sanguibacter gelidistatuariae]SDD08632.1 ATP-dependent DNA ligase LigD ligase module /ATP-dependent DNA ligase LigD phosphoesterase module /ATP-dependent DNA ligase LigD polymerase module [Sanguibacter gelidistatuariae]
MPTDSAREIVTIDGHSVTLTNLARVVYPQTGTTKAEVLAYFAAVAGPLVVHAAHRPATRKRWVHGTGGPVFFQKNLEDSAPAWVHRREIQHSDHVNTYPLVDDLATLTWLGQIGALEIHVPQWRFGRTGAQHFPDRLVLDLDPGPGTGLAECAEVARWARTILTEMGMDLFPVTSGSKGIHLYATLDGTQSWEAASAVAHELARALEADHGDLVVSEMKKSLRVGKVLVDWSQNNRNKTTITPYSLRGRERPTVAAPRTWAELDDPGLAHLEADEVVSRFMHDGDLLAGLLAGGRAGLEPTPGRLATFEQGADRLAVYRSRRDPGRTPEPVPSADEPAIAGGSEAPIFVIQDHHARGHHFDFRLERDGVLVSWALPKGEPVDPSTNHLAVQTEDHPLEYANFSGTIPRGEYGAGTVSIWDAGTYEVEKWREGEEIIVVVHSSGVGGVDRGSRRLALIHTGHGGRGRSENSWLIHRMGGRGVSRGGVQGLGLGGAGTRDTPAALADEPTALPARPPEPMLATPGTFADLERLEDSEAWAFEMKWDGIRALASVTGGIVRLTSRNGIDLTATYPELAELSGCVGEDVLLDGEIVALNRSGRPDFGLLQNRMNLTREAEVAAARAEQPVDFMAFDLLHRGSRRMTTLGYDARRRALEEVLDEHGRVHLPPAFTSGARAAIEASLALGLEGVVAKRRSSTYRPGRRSPAWIKVKHVQTREVVVVGWRTGKGSRASTLGSLLVAVPGDAVPNNLPPDNSTSHNSRPRDSQPGTIIPIDIDRKAPGISPPDNSPPDDPTPHISVPDDAAPSQSARLRYAGRVGTGFTDKTLTRLRCELDLIPHDTAPLDDVPDADRIDAHWVVPDHVGEVSFAGWTGAGRLRHPVWLGWRPDKSPTEVTIEADESH